MFQDGSGWVGMDQERMGLHPALSQATHQLEHPGAAAAGGEAAEGAQEDNDGASAHQDEWDIGGFLVQQGEVDGQAHPAPDAHGQQHNARHLVGRGESRSGSRLSRQGGAAATCRGVGWALTQKTKV